jgi:recombination protein RecT
MENQITTKDFFARNDVKLKFAEMLGKRSAQFMTSVLQIVSSNELLKKADPASVYNSAAVAATLDLPLNNSLGFAYIVPYNNKQKDGTWKTEAQFQIGWKGLVQLAQRTGQYLSISTRIIYAGQYVEDNSFEGFHFDWNKKNADIIIGYASYFKLVNGFEKILFMSAKEAKDHGKKYSQTFKKDQGKWVDDFNGMALKTVLKLNLSKYGPLSIEMQRAIIADQAIIRDADTLDVDYADNEIPDVNKEHERITLMIQDCKTLDELKRIEKDIPMELIDQFAEKQDQLKEASKQTDLFPEKKTKKTA